MSDNPKSQTVLTPAKFVELKNEGISHKEIAKRYGLTVSGIQQIVQHKVRVTYSLKDETTD